MQYGVMRSSDRVMRLVAATLLFVPSKALSSEQCLLKVKECTALHLTQLTVMVVGEQSTGRVKIISCAY